MPNSRASSAYEWRRTAGSWAQVLTTISSRPSSAASARMRAPPRRACRRRRGGASAPGRRRSAREPRAAMSSGRCSGPSTPRCAVDAPALAAQRVVRASASLSAASAQMQIVACGRGGGRCPCTAGGTAQGLLDALAVHEEVGEGIGQAEVRRQLRAVVGAAQHPDLGRALEAGIAAGGARGWATAPRCCWPRVQAIRSCTCSGKRRRVRRVGVQQRAVRMSLPGARPTPRSMRPGASASSTRNCSATLKARVVRQHHAGAADAGCAGCARRSRPAGSRARADDGRQAVVLADPEAVVAQRFAVHRQVQRVAQRVVFTAAGAGNGLVRTDSRHAAECAARPAAFGPSTARRPGSCPPPSRRS
jgi:hypothetical protein